MVRGFVSASLLIVFSVMSYFSIPLLQPSFVLNVNFLYTILIPFTDFGVIVLVVVLGMITY